MNIIDILSLEPGTLIKGIDNSLPTRSILNVDGWNNPNIGEYVIRTYNLKKRELEINRSYSGYRINYIIDSKASDRVKIFKTNKGLSTHCNIEILTKILYDPLWIRIGSPIGIFLGEIIIEDYHNSDIGIVLMKIFNKDTFWISLKTYDITNLKEHFDIY